MDLIERLKSKYVILSEDEIDNLYGGNVKQIHNSLVNEFCVVNSNTIKTILLNHFENLQKVFNDDTITVVALGYVKNGDINALRRFSKSTFAKAVQELCLTDNSLQNDPIVMDRARQVLDYVNVESVKSEDFTTEIDNKVYSIPVKDMINFITYERHNCDLNNPKTTIHGYTKNEFFFMIKMFCSQEHIAEKYLFSEENAKFLKDVIDDKLANTYHFNRINFTKDENLQDTEINEEFKAMLVSNMPEDFTKLEKSIYLYIKMCQTLTYDPEFYIEEQSGDIATKHEDLNRIKTITEENPEVVCYEAVQIYAKLLSELGINYELDKQSSKKYGGGHANLTFKVDDVVVFADPVSQIFGGDLYNAKIFEELKGLECKNKNSETITSFQQALTKVYNYIKSQENNPYVHKDSTKKWASIMCSLAGQTPEIDLQQKIDIYKEKLIDSTLPLLDKFTYSKRLLKVIFSKEFEKRYLNCVSLKKLKYLQDERLSMPVQLVEIKHENSFKYFILDEKGTITEPTAQDICEKLMNGTYEFKEPNDYKHFDIEIVKGLEWIQ